MSTTALPPDVIILPPPPESGLGEQQAPSWQSYRDDDERGPNAMERARQFPERAPAEDTSERLFACSGSIDSAHYREATQYRTLTDMTWPEARVALNRLVVAATPSYGRRVRVTAADCVALAEFALAAAGFEGFQGRKGDNAVKLRTELGEAISRLRLGRLHECLSGADKLAAIAAKPITACLSAERWGKNHELWASVPTAADTWVTIIEATAEQATAALDFLRATLATWQERRPFAAEIFERLDTSDPLPTAEDFAEALHIAEMLSFTGEKLTTLYAGIMHSMPVFRLYPAATDHEAIALWWPWGLIIADRKPPRPQAATAAHVLDPALITTTRPSDVVKEVMAKTGMSRNTAQRLTAALRADMRRERVWDARALLLNGMTRAAVAREVGLSPSRISALLKGLSKGLVARATELRAKAR